ncbi:hypothetical protein [Paenibacillus sp. CMAA1364]
MDRKPIGKTNIPNVVGLAVVFSILFGAATENLTWFLASVSSVLVICLLLYAIWLKFGDNGIRVNSINVFIMLVMLTMYTYIPFLYLTWDTPLGWQSMALYILVFIMSFVVRENMVMKINPILKVSIKSPISL